MIAKRYRNELILLLASAVFYLVHIDAQVPWNDEVFSIIDSRSLTGLNLLTRPVFYFFLHVWMVFSESLIWMRSLSACFSALSVMMTYRLAKMLLGESVGWLSAGCLLLSVVARNHAHEIRMYSMGTFLILLGTYYFAKSLAEELPREISGEVNPEINKNLNGWAIFRLASFLTIPLSVTILAADMLILLSKRRTKGRLFRSCVARTFVILVLWGPSFYFMNREKNKFFSDWVADRIRPSLASVLDLVARHFTFGAAPLSRGWFFWGTGGIVLSLMILPIWKRPTKTAWGYVVSWTLLPCLILTLYSSFAGNLWVPRYFLFLQPFFLILLANGLFELGRSQRTLGLLTAVGYFVLCVSNLTHPEWTRDHSQASYKITQEITLKETSADRFLLLASEPARYSELLRYFYHGKLVISAPAELGRNGDSWSFDTATLNRELAKLFESKARIWLVFRPTGLNPSSASMLDTVLKNNFTLKSEKTFYLMSVYLLEPRSGPFIKL